MDDLLTLKETADLLRISTSQLYRIKNARKIPFYQIGGKILFKKSDLEKWLEENKH